MGRRAQAEFTGSQPAVLAALRSSITPLKEQARALCKDIGASLAETAATGLESLAATMAARVPEDYSWLLVRKAERDEAVLEERVWSKAKEYESLWSSIKPVTRTLSSIRQLEKQFPPGLWEASLAPAVTKCQAGVQHAQTFATALCVVNIAVNKLRLARKSPAASKNVLEMVGFVERHNLQSQIPQHLWEEVLAGLREAGLRPAAAVDTGAPGNPAA